MKTIGIFKSACPGGWTRYSGWDGKFLLGASSYGAAGGGESHCHPVTMAATTTGTAVGQFAVREFYNHPYACPVAHTHSITFSLAYTDYRNAYPPFIDVVYCYKET